jgi:hypothetical protein
MLSPYFIFYKVLPHAITLSATAYCRLLTAYCQLLTANCLLPTYFRPNHHAIIPPTTPHMITSIRTL